MSSNPSDSPPPRPGSFQAMRSWLRGMVESLKPSESGTPKGEEILPTWDAPGLTQGPPSPPPPPSETSPLPGTEAATSVVPPAEEAAPVAGNTLVPFAEFPTPSPHVPPLTPPGTSVPMALPLAEPVTPPSTPLPMPASEVPSAVPLAEPLIPPLPSPALSVAEPVAASPPLAVPVPVCPVCALPRTACGVYCESCGFLFPSDAEPAAEPPLATAAAPAAAARIRGRYELGDALTQRGSVERFSSPGPRHRRRGAGAGHRGARACAATGRIGSGCRTRLGAVGELDGGDRAWVRRASRPFSAGHRLPRGPAVLAEPGLGTEHSGGSSTSLSARGAGRIYRGGPRLPHRGTAHRNSPVGFLGRGGGLRGAALPLAPAHRRAACRRSIRREPCWSRCGRTSSS